MSLAPNEAALPKAVFPVEAPNTVVVVPPNAGVVVAPKAGAVIAPNAGVVVAPNAGVVVAPKVGVVVEANAARLLVADTPNPGVAELNAEEVGVPKVLEFEVVPKVLEPKVFIADEFVPNKEETEVVIAVFSPNIVDVGVVAAVPPNIEAEG